MLIEVKYDGHDRMIFSKITVNDGGAEELILHTEAGYNEDGKVIYSYTHNPRFNQTVIAERTYDSQGLLLENVQQIKVGEEESYTKTVYTYDGVAPTSITVTDKEGTQQTSLEFQEETVDGKTYYVASVDGQIMRLCVDEAGNTTLIEILAGDILVSRNETVYNENGDPVRTTSTNVNGTTMTYEYSYTEDGIRAGTSLQQDGVEVGYTYTTYITVTP